MRVENPAWHIKTGGKWRRPLSGSNILARLELQSEVSVDRLVSNIRPPTLSFIQSVMAGSLTALTSLLTSLTFLLSWRVRTSSPNCWAEANKRLQSRLGGTDRTSYLESARSEVGDD